MEIINFDKAKNLNSSEIRDYIRKELYAGHTAGLAKNKLQTNIVVLPSQFSDHFLNFCHLNKKACPIVDKTKVGDPFFHNLGRDIDVRLDVPRYNIYKNGKLLNSTKNIKDYWEDTFVAFAIGCSFTFEHELLRNNLELDHIKNNKIVPMYKTNIKNKRSGVFASEMVTSMRIFKKSEAKKVITISKKYSQAHGEPVHVGSPERIGINNILKPNWGDPPRVKKSDEDYYFWACGVTPQNAVMEAKLPFCITHTPGHMLITDTAENKILLT